MAPSPFLDQALRDLGAVHGTLDPDVPRLIGAWLDLALERTGDELWATRFHRACRVPGTAPQDYLHRVLEPARGSSSPLLLAGIRFKGGDVAQPFVELLAWDRPIEGPRAWRLVLRRLKAAFETFQPQDVRVRWPGTGAPPVAPDLRAVDQWLVAGPLSTLRARPRPWGWGSVDVREAEGLDWYDTFREQFAAWQERAGDRGREVQAAHRDDLARCLEHGLVMVAWSSGEFAGVMAVRPAAERWMAGFEVQELFLGEALRGQRKAPLLQRHVVERLPDRGRSTLYGTIHRTNLPSLKTARRCGRRIVETWWFVGLSDGTR